MITSTYWIGIHIYMQLTLHLRWMYAAKACADGNFHCEKMFMKRAENDVSLHDGEAYMVESTRYKQHLDARSSDKQDVSIRPIILLL